jgi:hypothetical protein
MFCVILSYIGPDQMIPLATPIAMALGVVLMFGRYLLSKLVGIFKFVFSWVLPRGAEPAASDDPAILPFPGVGRSHATAVQAPSEEDERQEVRRAA